MAKLERAEFRPRTRDDLVRHAAAAVSGAVETRRVGAGSRPPLIVDAADGGVDLVAWATSNRDRVNQMIADEGALLFRGFHLEPGGFARFAQVICPEPFEGAAAERGDVGMATYQPSFFPANQKLLWHNEDNFDHSRWPATIMFCCHKQAEQGGETTFVDSRAVFQALDPGLRERFARKQIMYVRNYWPALGHHWSSELRASTPEEVEAYCARNHMSCEWVEGSRLRLRWVRPAIQIHPRTGEALWFNLLIHWHPARFGAEQREAMASTFEEADLPGNCYYGDGSPIEPSIVQEVVAACQELEICFPWRPGDTLLLDNMMFAHGRNPYVGERRLEVAMGGSIHYLDLAHLRLPS